MSRTILVFGASGTIGQGLIKVSLEQANTKVVGIFRSEESAKKTSERLGNPPTDKFEAIIGSVGSDQSAAELQKQVTEKVGSYTDVVSSVGGFGFINTILEMPVEEFKKTISTDKLEPHFLIAKYFLLPISDKEGTSFTIINGGSAYQPIPKFGHMTVANGALMKLVQVIMAENKDKPIRVNEFVIAAQVLPWDTLETPLFGDAIPYTDNLKMGKALLGVIIHPTAKGVVMNVSTDNVEKLANEGSP